MYDMRLITLWKAPKAQGHIAHLHSHDYQELVYYVAGKGETTIENDTYTYSDGYFSVIPPHVVHSELSTTDTVVICLEYAGAPDLPKSFGKDALGTILKSLKELLSEVKHQRYGYQEVIVAKLNELYWQLLRAENTNSDEKNFEYIINYIQENYHEKIRLSDCARMLNISYDYFQHKFKQITGLSPQQFLLRQRLTASTEMLRANRVSCTDIAYRCGFSTSSQYSTLFKKAYGLTPTQFQKNAEKAEKPANQT